MDVALRCWNYRAWGSDVEVGDRPMRAGMINHGMALRGEGTWGPSPSRLSSSFESWNEQVEALRPVTQKGNISNESG